MSFDPKDDQSFDFDFSVEGQPFEGTDSFEEAAAIDPFEEPAIQFESDEIPEHSTAGEMQELTQNDLEQDKNQEIENAVSPYFGKFSAPDPPVKTDKPEEKADNKKDSPELRDLCTDSTENDDSNFSDKVLPELSEEFRALPPHSAPKRKKKSAARTRAVKKGRPRRRKGEGLFGIPNILVTIVWCALTLLISVTLGRLIWVCAAEVLAFGREDKTVTITVYEEDTIEDITKKLARAELIHYPGLFKLYAQFAVDDGEIRPGMWDLNTKYDYHALVKMMSPSSSRDVVKVTIPEGYTCRQIFLLLEENKVCTSQDMASYAAYGELDNYWFLENVARGDKYCLECFMFPDTYEFYKNDTPKNVLSRMLNNFNNRFDENLRWQIQNLNAHLTDLMRRNGYGQDYINSHLFDVKDIVNVAAMIEKETSSVQEGYTIASVIYNRLFCWGNNPAYLNIDATIVYALEGKTDLTAEDLRVDSPYNTYTNLGLPKGPIANPGLASIKAALDPSDTNYYFYVLDPAAGSHHFSTTQAEHEAFRASLGG